MRIISLLIHDVYQHDPTESGFLGLAADRYKLTVGQFEAQLASLARSLHEAPILIRDVPELASDRLRIAFTVDDGGVSYYTMVSERLEALGWRGHCFVTTGVIGQQGFLDKRQIRELHARGHIIGSHSVSHPRKFGACSWDKMLHEWRGSRKALQDILGDDVTVASLPGGYFSAAAAKAAYEAGLRVLFTSEPQTRMRNIGGCIVAGRFTIRPGCRSNFTQRLASLQSSILLREWMAWNAKKVLKFLLGTSYPILAEYRLRLSPQRAGTPKKLPSSKCSP